LITPEIESRTEPAIAFGAATAPFPVRSGGSVICAVAADRPETGSTAPAGDGHLSAAPRSTPAAPASTVLRSIARLVP
jgi:hypothetical protein